MNIIYNDKSIAVIEKPSGIPSQPDKTGDADIAGYVAEDFGYAGVVHRLDRPVSGLMVFALNKKAEAFLSAQMSERNFHKIYYAVCCGKPREDEKILKDMLVKNQRLNISTVADRGNRNAKEAVLKYKVLDAINDDKFGVLSLLEVELYTGRHHQIRVQLSNAGIPLWGDAKYNPAFGRGYHNVNIALYSERLEFIHPETKKTVGFEKKPDFMPFSLFTFCS